MRMRRRKASAARPRPVVPVEPTADGAASYSAVQLRRGPRTAHGPSWSRGRRCPAEHAARCRSCGVANGVVDQVGPSGTAHGSSELVKAHTPRRGRHSCRNRAARPGAGNYASSYACLGTAGRETILGIAGCGRAGGAARLGVDLHVYACSLGTAGRGTRKGTVGCERAGGAA